MWPWGICISMNFLKCRVWESRAKMWGLQTVLDRELAQVERGWPDVCWSSASILQDCAGHTQLWHKCKLTFLRDKLGHRGHEPCCPLSVAENGSSLFVLFESSSAWHRKKDRAHRARTGTKGNWRFQMRKRNSTFTITLHNIHHSFHHNIMPTSLLQTPASTTHAFPERSGFFWKAQHYSPILVSVDFPSWV